MRFGGWGAKSGNKFGARKSVYKGIEFDSTVERQRYMYLECQEQKGEISCLRRQVRFLIIPKLTRMVAKQLKTKVRYDERVVELPAYYTSDFCYIENGVYVMEDVKNGYSQEIRLPTEAQADDAENQGSQHERPWAVDFSGVGS